MKQNVKRFFLVVLLLAIYLAGVCFGACAICIYPAHTQKEPAFERARAVTQEFLSGRTDHISSMIRSSSCVFIYNTDGVCLLSAITDDLAVNTVPSRLLEKCLSSTLNGKDSFRMTATWNMKGDGSLFRIVFIFGVPMMENGSVIGTALLAYDQGHLPASLIGYGCYFTVFYWVTAYFIVSNIRKSKKLEKVRQAYIANVTHAFKTPIASIKALAETLCDGVEPDPDRQKVYYGMILREANRQHHMIQDVLELSKLQSNGMDFTKTNVCAAGVFDPVLNKYATLCDCMGISLHISEEISRLPPLYTNPACVKQLLEILLDNALKFVHEGGDIWVETACTRNKATICVRDNGIGIAKEALPHVFERFYKCGHDFNESGSGLGLAIAEEIVSGLKEKIWAESEPGKGTAFFFTVHHR